MYDPLFINTTIYNPYLLLYTLTLTLTLYTGCIYLDYNATTPIYPEVALVIQQHLDVFGNPSSPHAFARKAKVGLIAIEFLDEYKRKEFTLYV
jgi:hypothetical protein